MAPPRAPRLRLEQLEDRSVPAVIAGFAETNFATGLVQPTAMAVAPDGRIFVAEKGGTLRVVQSNGALLSTPFLTVGVNTVSERGLIGVAFDPNFATNRFVYVYYTTNAATPMNRVSRFTADASNPNVAAANSEFVVIDNIPSTNGNHNGGALVFRPDGKLYIGVGEAGVPANSQTTGNLLGKVLRINSDGSVPNDNPFVGTMGARPEIWALGLRNPFTMAVQPGTGTLYINDVGGGLFEEVNVGIAGANYGWSNTEGDFNQATFPLFSRPLVAYAHGTAALQGNSIAGGAFYNPTSGLFPPQYTGDYFFADFVRNRIFVRDANTGAVSTFADGTAGQGVVDLDVLPDGRLLYLSLISGSIVQITPTAPVTPTSSGTSAVAAGSGGTVFALNSDGSARFAVRPFGAFAGSVRVATGDMNGDGIEDVIAVRGPGAPPEVVLYDGANGLEAGRFFAFDGRYTGGLNVTAGDVTGDGKADVIVSSVTGIAAVQVFDVAAGRMVALFNAFPGYGGGASVAAGDIDQDGRADIIAGTLAGVSGVRVFSGLTFAPIREFLAFGPVPVGVNVGFVNGEIVTGTATGQAFVRIFNSAGVERITFAAAPPQFNTGITVAALGNQLLAGVGGFAAAYDMASGAFLAAAVPFGGAGVFVG